MTRSPRCALGVALLLAASCFPASANADANLAQAAADPPQLALHRWGVGFELGVLELPSAHAGLPLGTIHLPVALTLRYQATEWWALAAGVGIPQATGLSAWLQFEIFHSLVQDARGILMVELYAATGLQLGFVGRDWGARHRNDFVPPEYIYQGPLAFALRFPVGVRLRWAQDRFETYLESAPALFTTPSTEVLFGLVVGCRLRL